MWEGKEGSVMRVVEVSEGRRKGGGMRVDGDGEEM